MPRSRKRSPEDDTGRRLLQAGRRLLRTGTPVDELRLADAVALASIDGEITSGAAYPRFGSQERFRLAVLASLVEFGPRHRDASIDAFMHELAELVGDLELSAEDVPGVVSRVAEKRQADVSNDGDLALRLYAQTRILSDSTPPEFRERLHALLAARDAAVNREWSRIIETLADDLDVLPHKDVDASDLEIAISSLLTGLAIRGMTTELAPDLYGRLICALLAGFYEERKGDRARWTVRGHLLLVLGRRKSRRLAMEKTNAMRREYAEARDAETSAVADMSSLSDPVRRALAAENRV